MVDLIGQTLGQYRIIEQIGQGGMATVYKAYQPSLDRYVAVKILPPYFAHEPGFAMRFTREAKAIARLNHPNILPIYDFGQEGDLSYIAMKFVKAGTLKDIMDDEPLPLDVTADILRQIAGALDHAHQRGILHRDVKPSNVLLDEGRWVLLTDFGLAKMVEGSVALTGSGVGVGTPAYMAPEQGRGGQVDARADIYSLGVVLYEMLTGQVPFQAETPMAVVIKHITDPLPLPRSVNPELPEAVERVILKALAKDPDDRFASTGKMADALAAATAAAVEPAPPTIEIPPVEPLPVAPPTPTPAPVEAEPVPAMPPEQPTPVPTPTPLPTEIPSPARKPFPWKVVGGVLGVVMLALAAIFAVSNLGGEEAVDTPTPVAGVTEKTATPTPEREPTATEPSRLGEELRGVQFEEVYLQADFERPGELRIDLPGGWAIGDDGSGNHILVGKGHESFLFPDGLEWRDYVLEARVMLVEGKEGAVFVRRPGDAMVESGVRLTFAVDRWELCQDPGDRCPVSYPVNNMGQWHHLRVVVVEHHLAAFLDDDLMFDADIDFSSGSIGFGVHEDSVVYVDDLRVTGPPLAAPEDAARELYDDFDQGFVDEERWEWLPAMDGHTAEVDDRGRLLIRAENPSQDPQRGDLRALTDRPIVEVMADLTVEHLEGENTDLGIKLSAEGPRFAGIVGEEGTVVAFAEEAGTRILLEGRGLSAQYHLHLILTPEGAMHVVVDGREVGAIPAPPVAEGFSMAYQVDPGGALVARLDNVQVRYAEQSAMPGERGPYHCEDELGCVDVLPGGPIHIVYLLDRSGATQFIGEDSLRGIELAVEERMEILGHPIELTGEDSGCDSEAGRAAAARIAGDPSVLAVIGPTCSNAGATAAPVISQAGLVMVSPSNTRLLLTDPRTHEPGYLRTAPSDRVQAVVAARFAREVLGVTRAATLYDGGAYSRAFQQVFAVAFRELGGEITVQAEVRPDDTDDLTAKLALVAQTEPQLLFYPLFVEMGGLVTRHARETDGLGETILVGGDDMFGPQLLEVAGPAADGLYLSTPDLTPVSDAYPDFVGRYVDRYGERPQSVFHAYAYDATMIILAAIEQVAVQDGEALHIGRQALRDALFGTRGFEGLTGVLSCTPHGDCADARAAVYQVVSAEPDSWDPGSNPIQVWP